MVRAFNTRSRSIKILFVNQFGWDRQSCGEFLSADAEFVDLRRGSDVEFGQSIYEPFGIAQIEPLGYGTICVVSDVCGCVGFVDQVSARQELRCFIEAAYTRLEPGEEIDSSIGIAGCQRIEALESQAVAEALAESLPLDASDRKRLLAEGYSVAREMSWDRVVEEMLLPVFRRLGH